MNKRLVCVALLVPVVAACSGSSGGSTASNSPSPTATATVSHPPGKQIASLTGTTDATTKTFTVTSGWELQFQINAANIAIELVDPAGKKVANLITYKGPGGGSIFSQQSGTFALKITAHAKWRIQVINH